MDNESQSAMRVVLAKLDLFLPYAHSLKEKRHVLHKIKDKIFAEFKVPVHEIAYLDKWQRGQLGMALVGNDGIKLQALADKIIERIHEYGLAEILNVAIDAIDF